MCHTLKRVIPLGMHKRCRQLHILSSTQRWPRRAGDSGLLELGDELVAEEHGIHAVDSWRWDCDYHISECKGAPCLCP